MARQQRKIGPREKQIYEAGVRTLRAAGFVVYRLSQARRTNQSPGIPDAYAMHPQRGLALWWEAKRPGGTQSPPQRQFEAECRACGLPYLLGGTDVIWTHLYRLGLADETAAGPMLTPCGRRT